jgi:hypothetical protein
VAGINSYRTNLHNPIRFHDVILISTNLDIIIKLYCTVLWSTFIATQSCTLLPEPELCRYHVITEKVKQSHSTPMEAQGGEDVQLLLIHDFGARWGWVVSVTTRPCYTLRERIPRNHCTGGWGHRAGLDTDVRGKIILPLPGIKPRSPSRPVRSQTLYWLSYLASYVMTVPGTNNTLEFRRYLLYLFAYL